MNQSSVFLISLMKNLVKNNMKKLLLILGFIFSVGAFAQQKDQAIEIILANVDSSYFDENGTRWHEFSLTLNKAFKVNDLFESDTTLKECFVVKGSRAYKKFIKENYPGMKPYRREQKVFGHLDCVCDNYLILIWMYDSHAFGMMATLYSLN